MEKYKLPLLAQDDLTAYFDSGHRHHPRWKKLLRKVWKRLGGKRRR